MSEKKLHIALISTSYPDSCDGSEAAGSFVSDFAYELSKLATVTVVAPALHSGIERINESPKVIRFSVDKLPLSLLKITSPLDWIKIVRSLSSGSKALDRLMSDEDVDLAFALWSLPSGYWAKKSGKKYHVPYITWSLGSDIWGLGKVPVIRQVLKKVLTNSIYNYSDGIELSERVENISGAHCGFLPSSRNIGVIEDKIIEQSSPYKLAYLGRWHTNKGVDILLDSLAKLSSSDWSKISEIKIYGGGPLEAVVIDNVNKLSLTGRPVSMGGYLNKMEAVELLSWADIVLLPSRIESIPVIFSDAMKCQCPIVSMPVGDMPQLVKKYQVGIVANSITSESFSTAISKMLEKNLVNYKSGMSNASRDFDTKKAVEAFYSLLVSEI